MLVSTGMMLISAFGEIKKINSNFISKSTGINAVIIRNFFIQLKNAGLILVSPGPRGAKLAKTPKQVNLWGIYVDVEASETKEIFKFHENMSPLPYWK